MDENMMLKEAFLAHLSGILVEPMTITSLRKLEATAALARRMLEATGETYDLPGIESLSKEVEDIMSSSTSSSDSSGPDFEQLAQMVMQVMADRNRPTMKELLVCLTAAKKEGLDKVAEYIEKQLLEMVGEVGHQ